MVPDPTFRYFRCTVCECVERVNGATVMVIHKHSGHRYHLHEISEPVETGVIETAVERRLRERKVIV